MDRIGQNSMAQTGLAKFKQGLATGGRQSQALTPQTKATPFGPPTANGGGRAPGLSFKMPESAQPGMFRPGNTVHGKVTGQKNGMFFLNVGEQSIQAQSRVPLKVGDTISLQVQGQNQGQVHMRVLDTPATKMTMTDLSSTLTSLKVPMDAQNMSLAKTMVELKVPLTRENFSMMKQVVANAAAQPQGPVAAAGHSGGGIQGSAKAGMIGPAGAVGGPQAGGPAAQNARMGGMTMTVAAASFLSNSSLAVSPQNVSVMSNFLSNNPQVGMQMVSMNTELKKLVENTNNLNKDISKMINDAQKTIGKMIMEPPARNQGQAKNSKNLKDMAKQTGIEFNLGSLGFGGGEEWDFAAILQRMRERFAAEGIGGDELMALMKSLEENLEAQKLINLAKSESNLGYYFLQIPTHPDPAELWLEYLEDSEGNRVVDGQDTRIEFLVNTEEMGELHFLVEVRQGKASVFLGTASEEVRRFAAPFLPALAERILALGYERGHFRTVFRPHSGKRELVEHSDFETLERFNVQA